MEREYIISLKKGVNYDEFWNEIENLSSDDNFVPSRRVDIINNRDGSLRSCHYALTDQEAELLIKDPRVFGVNLPPDKIPDAKIGLNAKQISNFDKPTTSAGSNTNWGLKRCIVRSNIYETNNASPSSNYDYMLDGSGVDIVIQDSGIEVNHPEFKDSSGNSRIQLINWYTEAGIAGTQNANHYRDFDGHGTHVAAIATGLTYGWAKNAHIYSMKLSGLEGAGDSGTGISITDCFDLIKLWHQNKPIDPKTGVKRPTIVNMSWGYLTTYTSISSLTYRGVTYTDNSTLTDQNYRWANYGLLPVTDGSQYFANRRIPSVDSDIQELIDAGVHVITAAGNRYHKVDLSAGTDYNNNYVSGGSTLYYHRGSSPSAADADAINVGNINNTVYNASLDKKNDSSECGPGVDIYAPGSSIISAVSNTNLYSGASYHLDSGFKQASLTGTSQAAPQVAGFAALVLQMNPRLTPNLLKQYIINKSVSSVIYDTGLDNDWSTSFTSLKGGPNKFLFSPISIAEDENISGDLTFENISLTLT